MISNQQLFEKFVLLDSTQRQAVYEFINTLLSKQPIKKEPSADFLLQTSVWNDDDIQLIEDAQKAVNSWTPATW